jgi:hypothetical protein
MNVVIVNKKTKEERTVPQELADKLRMRSKVWSVKGPEPEKKYQARPKVEPESIEPNED